MHAYGVTFQKDGTTDFFELYEIGTYKIKIEPGTNEKGTIWINPAKNQMKLDLNQKIEWKFNAIRAETVLSKLTYVIDEAEKNATFIFKYNNTVKDYNGKVVNVDNPFQVCHGDDCKENITTYDFKQGESYKIYINVKKSGNIYALPSFSFYDIKNNSFYMQFNFWVLALLFLIL